VQPAPAGGTPGPQDTASRPGRGGGTYFAKLPLHHTRAALEIVKGGAGIGLAAFLRRSRAESRERIVTEGIGSGAGFGGIGEDVELRRRCFGRSFEGGFALCFCHWVVWVWVEVFGLRVKQLRIPRSARRPIFYPTGFRVDIRAATPDPADARFWRKSMSVDPAECNRRSLISKTKEKRS